MKIKNIIGRVALFALISCAPFTQVICSNLNGTASVVYKNQHHVFSNGESAQGYVRMNGGFTVKPGATATLDTVVSVSGSIDLRETGILQLLKDLKLDAGLSWSSGGYIKGRGRALILNDTLSIPASKIIHISDDTIIDGKGNTLLLNSHAQLLVENGITLTLRNLMIKTRRNNLLNPALKCTGNSKLTLDNVVLAPSDSISFKQGQIFIHNDVFFTGTNALIYRSSNASFITSGARFYFDIGTTLSYAPTSTDAALFVLQDKTSTLHLNGCSLETTATGMRLTKGRLLLDNKVAIRTNANIGTLSTLSTNTSVAVGDATAHIFNVDWSPDGKVIALATSNPASGAGGFANTDELRLYTFGGSSLTPLTSKDYGSRLLCAAWSPDGRYIALGGDTPISGGGFANTDEIRIYSFDGTTLTPVTSRDYGSIVTYTEWSPDGKYLAIAGVGPSAVGGFANTDEIRVYSFDGATLTPVTSRDFGSFTEVATWSPDGSVLAIGGNSPTSGGTTGFANTNELRLYSFNGSTLTPLTSQDYGNDIYSARWHPSGQFLAIGGDTPISGGGFANTNELRLYSFNGSSLAPVTSQDYGTVIYSVDWSPDGTILAIGGQGPASGGGFANTHELRLYSFNGSTLTPLTSKDWSGTNNIDALAWNPSGESLAVGGSSPTNPSGGFSNTDELRIYSTNYTVTSIVQSTTAGLIFGNSALGSSSNLSVEVLGAAHVTINGIVNDDSA